MSLPGPPAAPAAPSPPPSPSLSPRSRKVSTTAPLRPASPTGSVSTAKSAKSIAHSPRPVVLRKSYRRGNNAAAKVVPAGAGSLTESTSNPSISRSVDGNSNANDVAPPPSLLGGENASTGNPSMPLQTPTGANDTFLFDETLAESSLNQSHIPKNTILPDSQNPEHRRSLPRPLPPSRCPLLCVFYAEFDIVVGPKVCFQCPQKFMHLDIDVSFEDVHHSLEETFQAVIPKDEEKQPVTGGDNGNKKQPNGKDSAIDDINQHDSDEYWNWFPTKKTTTIDRETSDISSQITLPSSGHKDEKQNVNASALGKEGSAAAKLTHSRNPSFASSSKGTNSNPPTHEGDTSTIDTELMQNSIFAATSEYIITGNELANQTITVSTHGMHILSRPMIICDTQRYERNSLLFAVGFVLRRNVNPRPYWPVLSNLSSTFRAMEVESEFLSNHRTRPQIQIVLENILVSLNSKRKDCHLVMDDANMLNLHLFRPPPPLTPPVPDYAVPILLRPEWQLQMYDWDLTINWIVPHIDGCKYVKQIAVSSEVDMEMVRACLRVLRHHRVLAYVDVFRYSNVYEYTPLAMELLTATGKKADEVKDSAFWYSAKAKHVRQARRMLRVGNNDRNSPNFSPSNIAARRLHPHMSSLHSLDLSVHSTATPLASAIANEISRRQSLPEDLSRSFPSRAEHITIREEEEEGTANKGGTRNTNSPHVKQIDMMKNALAEMYLSCSRNQSFKEMLLAKFEDTATDSSPSDDHAHEKTVGRNSVDTTLAPLRETSESGVKNDNQQHGIKYYTDRSIDWRMAFDYFDHRRLITFGLVRGLIRRVHQYPLACEVETGADEANNSGSGWDASSHGANIDEADDYMSTETSSDRYHLPIEMSAMAETIGVTAGAKAALDERSRTPSYTASPQLKGFPTPPLNSRDGILLSNLGQKEMQLRAKKLLMERIASAMDGTRCDDELSCMFEIPIEKLIDMLKETGRWNVISVFSCTS